MNRTKTITLATIFSIVLLLSVTFVANAQANRIYFNAVEYDCFVDVGTEPWMEGNVMHMRNVTHVNVDVSDTPEFNGLNSTLADAEFNMKTGGAVIRGTLSFQPQGIAGTWEGTWIFTGNKGQGVAQAVAQGTGALAGKTLFLKLFDAEPDDPRYENLPEMCAGIGEPESVILIEGYFIDTGMP